MKHHTATLLWLFAALILYSGAAAKMLTQQSLAPHYVHLADSFLHGQTALLDSAEKYDVLAKDGNAYVAGSPLPAILLLPAVAIWGNQISDVVFSVIIGTFNVALCYYVFRRHWVTLLFALGTPHLYLASTGTVWFQAQVVAIFFGLLAVEAGWRREKWLWAGVWLACAALARPTLLFGAAFFAVLILLKYYRLPKIDIAHKLTQITLPLLICIALHFTYNNARFGDPFDFGYGYVVGAENITTAYERYGGFHPHFLSCNLFVSILNPPRLDGAIPETLFSTCDHLVEQGDFPPANSRLEPNPLGMSILLTTPALFLLAFAIDRRPTTIAGWCGVFAIMLPLWMYHNTGSTQFGYRYWMDAAPFWLLLLTQTHPKLTTRATQLLASLLVIASIIINLWGWLWLYRLFFQTWPS